MHKNLVELNKVINAGAGSENIVANETEMNATVSFLSTVHGPKREDRLPQCHKDTMSS